MPLDNRKEQDIIHAFKDIESRGKVDFLINMAAINYFRKYNEIAMSEWDDVFKVNLRAMFIICREISRSMKKMNYGRIINVSSIAGRHRSISSGIHYVSSKAGVIGLTRQLSFELGPYGINVNAVCPGWIDTERVDHFSSTFIEGNYSNLEKRQIHISNVQNSVPLGRITLPAHHGMLADSQSLEDEELTRLSEIVAAGDAFWKAALQGAVDLFSGDGPKA